MPRKKPSPAAARSADGSAKNEDFERLGVFYLGRPYDPVAKQRKAGWKRREDRCRPRGAAHGPAHPADEGEHPQLEEPMVTGTKPWPLRP